MCASFDQALLAKQKNFDKMIFFCQRANLDFDILLEIFCANLAEIFKSKKEKLLQQLYQFFFENDIRLAILDVHLLMNCTSFGGI